MATSKNVKPLTEYERKRKFQKTPEPGPKQKASESGRIFVVQKHRASHLHYDLRLESVGVLKSWAVPKGPSLDPSVKRLAMAVEDHPVDYATFEGVIPEGEYGGGTVMVWDHGTFTPDKQTPNVQKAIEKGELKFNVQGKKLQGSWVLVRTRDRQWLLIKHRDAYASQVDIAETQPRSVLSERTLAEIARDEGGNVKKAATGDPLNASKESGKGGAKAPNERKSTTAATAVSKAKKGSESYAEAPKGSRRSRMPQTVKPMLAKLVDAPFSNEDWVFETKWDGVRAICFLKKGKYSLVSRNQKEMTGQYAELKDIPLYIEADQVVLDGEIVALDHNGFPRFQLLQSRFGLKGLPRVGDHNFTIVYYLFDVLHYNGYDITGVDLVDRKALLQQIVRKNDVVRYSDHIPTEGEKFFEQIEKLRLEGMIAKCADSKYVQSRSSNWLKVKTSQRAEVVIGGYTKPRGARTHFGAVVVGLYREGKLEYVGHTGGGFDQKSLKQLYDLMKPLQTDSCPFRLPPKTNEPVQWIKPSLVAEVKFSEWTAEHNMRHPIFMGLREDKNPKECVFETTYDTDEVVGKGKVTSKPRA